MVFFSDKSLSFEKLSELACQFYAGFAFAPINEYLAGSNVNVVTKKLVEFAAIEEEYDNFKTFVSNLKNVDIKDFPDFDKTDEEKRRMIKKFVNEFCLSVAYCLDSNFYWKSKPTRSQKSITTWRGLGASVSRVLNKTQLHTLQNSSSSKEPCIIIGQECSYLSTSLEEHIGRSFLTMWEGISISKSTQRFIKSLITGVKNQIYGKEKYKIKDQKILLKITVPSDIPRLELTNWTGESEVLLPTGILFKCNDVHIEEYVVIFDVTAMQIDIPSSSNSVRKLFHSKTLPSENNYKKLIEKQRENAQKAIYSRKSWGVETLSKVNKMLATSEVPFLKTSFANKKSSNTQKKEKRKVSLEV